MLLIYITIAIALAVALCAAWWAYQENNHD